MKLQTKYLIIIASALLLLPIAFPLISAVFYLPLYQFNNIEEKETINAEKIEKMWHEKAAELNGKSSMEIKAALQKVKEKYPDSELLWISKQGRKEYELPAQPTIPEQWSTGYTIDFMKQRIGGDPFTVVAFIGDKRNNAFIVFQLPRELMEPPIQKLRSRYDYVYIVAIVVMLSLFLVVSWLFFRGIRKRLLSLQKAMSVRDEHQIPVPISVSKKDEIGKLEVSFNKMIDELKTSRMREKEEEQLRRQLIANLSHDLRTPLTALRAHAYTLSKEQLSKKGKESLEIIDLKVKQVDGLIDNLLSYTLLMAKKYRFEPKAVDVLRIVKQSITSWYPVFEKEGFEINLDLPDSKEKWIIDPLWLERILDNLFQNIIRHAKKGLYVGVRAEVSKEGVTIVIEDKGQGMENDSKDKGAGIGLSIVAIMMKEMGLVWDVETSESGTCFRIWKKD
jgi:signal transduction histidine kinase